MNPTAHLLHLRFHKKAKAPQRRPVQDQERAPRAGDSGAEAVPCPVCGHRAGFILDEDGFGYRVLEDDRDTELLDDHADATPLACAHCDTTITLVEALALAHERTRHRTLPAHSARRPARPRGPFALAGHPHDAGDARWRTSADGRPMPGCPQCPRDHGFLADLDGVAYHVLEDDDDTELLADVDDLLCPVCGAVFTTNAVGTTTARPGAKDAAHDAHPHRGH